jgi:formate-dependent nitrite reductase membrane component NrfD
MPSTLFTEAPHWRWLIVFYFFLGGIAGGAYFLAALVDFFGRPTDRPLARLGYLIAFPLVVVCGLLLIVDLSRPERFWHMLIQAHTFRPMMKSYSPMSIGSWGVLLFGAFSFLSFLGTLAERDAARERALRVFRAPGILGVVITVLGGIFGLFLAGYTGVLLSVTNRPIWADTTLLGLTFLISSASTAAALVILLSWRRRNTLTGLRALERFDGWLLVFELVALIALVFSLGEIARLWLGLWGALLLFGVIGLGIVLPLLVHWRPRVFGSASGPVAAVLVLVGGFLLRVVVVLSSEGA